MKIVFKRNWRRNGSYLCWEVIPVSGGSWKERELKNIIDAVRDLEFEPITIMFSCFLSKLQVVIYFHVNKTM